ncbi:MAG TPA: DNA repair protein RadC [Syntrophales bacterium]|nr:DNA repair protein RadC [Syntrophales bacterium]HPO35691.1 DNA repair protein RadC [Syntrophales bacterium]
MQGKGHGVERPHYIGHRQRLRDRFLKTGVEGLHDYEILELLLTYAIPRKDVKPLAKELLNRFGSFNGVLDAELKELLKVEGISHLSACLIKLTKQLVTLYLKGEAKKKVKISSPKDMADFFRSYLGGLKEEQFCVAYLDCQNQLIDFDTLQRGTVNEAIVYPRQVLERALERKAASLILVHNHPSGVLKPSEADLRLTRTIKEAARLLDIVVHDHVIVGENKMLSFREEGIMP